MSGVTSSTANGSYKAGATVSIQVGFDENVTVTGTPQLALSSGGTADYASGSGTSTLTFTYTVARRRERAPTSTTPATGALTLNGGTIEDTATNNAALTLPAPGGAGSLGGQKAIVIDTTPPTVERRDLLDRERRLQGRRDRLDPGRLQRERHRHRHPAARA